MLDFLFFSLSYLSSLSLFILSSSYYFLCILLSFIHLFCLFFLVFHLFSSVSFPLSIFFFLSSLSFLSLFILSLSFFPVPPFSQLVLEAEGGEVSLVPCGNVDADKCWHRLHHDTAVVYHVSLLLIRYFVRFL